MRQKTYNENNLILFCADEKNPVGVDIQNLLFSWRLQNVYCRMKWIRCRFRIAKSEMDLRAGKNLLWEYFSADEVMEIYYHGPKLESFTDYYWKVTIEFEEAVLESDIAHFETGVMDQSDWKANWIELSGQDIEADHPEKNENGDTIYIPMEEFVMDPVWDVRKEFCINNTVKKARIYATALGIYQLYIDGGLIGDFRLAPEHTAYENKLLYQIYDVTEQLGQGFHTLSATVADGWYAGRMGFCGENCQYGKRLALYLQLRVEYEDKSVQTIVTDETFQVQRSAYEYADLMVGEKFNALKYNKAFFYNDYKGSQVRYARNFNPKIGRLQAQPGTHIEVLEVLPAQSISMLEEGACIVDFGQCIAGVVCLKLNGEPGQEIRIEHTEMEPQNGIFIKNIRETYRNQVDIYICSGGMETYEPRFTYHGFRYVRISGLTKQLTVQEITAKVIGTRLEETGTFLCSDKRLNQLQKNICRSQTSNMVGIPTDCPQREKAGWLGDVQIFAPTACYNRNMKQFLGRWLDDVRAQQRKDGQIPIIVPNLPGYDQYFEIDSSAGWSDAIVIVPWVLYLYYDDKNILAENYAAMEKWIGYQRDTAKELNPENIGHVTKERADQLQYIWNTGFHFADWLTPSASINLETGEVDMMQSAELTGEIVPTIFFAYSSMLMSRISEILGYQDKCREYKELYDHIREAFQAEYLDENGLLKTQLQGIITLTIQMDLVTGRSRELAVCKLVDLIRENGGKLDTGFLSTPFLLDVLCKEGYKKLAYDILFQEECPSWLYEINNGATSIWESWQAILPDGRCAHLSMSHYGFGCVGDWMYRNILGIRNLTTAYQKVLFEPEFDERIQWAKGSYKTKYGDIVFSWEKDSDGVLMHFEIPCMVQGEIHMNLNCVKQAIDEQGRPVNMLVDKERAGVRLLPGKYTLYIKN